MLIIVTHTPIRSIKQVTKWQTCHLRFQLSPKQARAFCSFVDLLVIIWTIRKFSSQFQFPYELPTLPYYHKKSVWFSHIFNEKKTIFSVVKSDSFVNFAYRKRQVNYILYSLKLESTFVVCGMILVRANENLMRNRLKYNNTKISILYLVFVFFF